MRLISVALVALMVVGCSSGESEPQTAADAPKVGAESGPEVAAQIDEMAVGKKIYGEYCFCCHGPGLNGAPKLGDAEAWAPRVAKGEALLLQTTIEGIPPAMPPRGICMSCSDEELAATIKYMISDG